MISIVYLSVALACASATGSDDANINLGTVHIEDRADVARGKAQDVGITFAENDLQRAKETISEQSKYHFSERGTGGSYYPDHAMELDAFLIKINGSESVVHCERGPFGCVQFSDDILKYLESYGQTNPGNLGTFTTEPADESTLSSYEGPTKHLSLNPVQLSAYALKFSDPIWKKQWHMQDYRTSNYPVMDHNIVPVLNMGITGKGVTVGIVGDGVKAHPDMALNFAEDLSYDFCLKKPGAMPFQRMNGVFKRTYDTKGTGSAGVIAMNSGNEICGVGIAPDAKIAGLKMWGCKFPNEIPIMDTITNIMQFNYNAIDIYSMSWTVDEYMGKKMIQMSMSLEEALQFGTTKGRNKKGTIIVFPTGAANCAINGYVNNPYVITIASANSNGKPASYSERCSAVFATAYSGDVDKNSEVINTIDADGGCTPYPSDKPLSSAVASGIFALVLEYKPSLTYRDMMHLIAMTAEVAPLADNQKPWYKNGRGLWVNSDFGFGLLNAENMIKMAKDWKTVPEKNLCVINKKLDEPIHFDTVATQRITIDVSECKGPEKGIDYLEHVELSVSIDCAVRGAVSMNLMSPAKTNTRILEPGISDTEKALKNLNFMSVQNWGENPNGQWTVSIVASPVSGTDNPNGYLKEVILKLHGTKEKPAHYDIDRRYAAFRLPNGDTNK